MQYTNFTLAEKQTQLSEVKTVVPELQLDATTSVTISVKNVGARTGDEVILAMFVPHSGTVPAGAPAARLKQQMFAFERVTVGASGEESVTFHISPDDLALYSADGDRMVYPGSYTLRFTNGVDQHVVKEIKVSTPTHAPVIRETFL
jgi:beta-glucosidase